MQSVAECAGTVCTRTHARPQKRKRNVPAMKHTLHLDTARLVHSVTDVDMNSRQRRYSIPQFDLGAFFRGEADSGSRVGVERRASSRAAPLYFAARMSGGSWAIASFTFINARFVVLIASLRRGPAGSCAIACDDSRNCCAAFCRRSIAFEESAALDPTLPLAPEDDVDPVASPGAPSRSSGGS